MTYGIIGNTGKEGLWEAVAALTRWLYRKGVAFRIHRPLAHGLAERGLVDSAFEGEYATDDPAGEADILLSFGGDGTLLHSAHHVGTRNTPILGVNIGRLGFLAKVEVQELEEALEQVEAGNWAVEERMALEVTFEGAAPALPPRALNDLVVDKSGSTSMIAIEALVDGDLLNTYSADGLIVATPTGSTAYNLSVGGPILMPGSGVVVVTPIAPHTLTARPIVLSNRVEVTLRVTTRGHPYVVAVDGLSTEIDGEADVTIRIRRAAEPVRLVALPGQDYFATLRDKLKWGQRPVF